MEKYKTPLLISPKSINELIASLTKYPDAQLFAGGTYIMSRIGYYPNKNPRDIISLENIPELTRVIHVDKYVELGAMVTIRQLLNSSVNIFSDELRNAISSIGSSVISRQITIGGALCTSGIRFSLPCILSAINTQAEIRSISRKGAKWIPVSKLYDNNGNYIFEGKGFVSRIRIPAEQSSVQVFKTVGNPMRNPSTSVILGLTYNIIQGRITMPVCCLVFPKGGFFCSQDFGNTLSKLAFPLNTAVIVKVAQDFEKQISDTCKNAGDLQKERAKRLLINTLYQANSYYLSN